jgi:hypothetical protein
MSFVLVAAVEDLRRPTLSSDSRTR